VSTPLWIDERLRELPHRPWRKIHLSFGGDPSDRGVGRDFDGEAFAATLTAAHVDAVVFPAKNIDGYCFYPSAIGPVHPGLEREDLLGEVVAACKTADIAIYPYYSLCWDEYLADRHPEWLVWRRDRSTYLAPFEDEPFLSALCMSHPGRMDLAFRRTQEVLERYDVDGIWFDEVFPFGGECFCPNCRDLLERAGKDPFDPDVQREHKHQLRTDVMRSLLDHVLGLRPGIQVDFNTQAVLGLRDRVDVVHNIDIEALPTGGWGYGYFPLHARFARTYGVSVYGMTGKFHRSWGEYGGLKLPTQLRTELAGIVAQACRCDIGDQSPPSGRLDAATYSVVGVAYGEIEQLEPHLEAAVPVTEAAIVVDGNPLARFAPVSITGELVPSVHGNSMGGLAKLLTECQVQFDVVDGLAEFERYRLVALPDSLAVDAALAERLNTYLANGGRVLASHRSLRAADTDDALWPASLRDAYRGPVPFGDVYARVDGLLGDRPEFAGFDFALFGAADRWSPASDVATLARLVEPSVKQRRNAWKGAPPEKLTDYSAVVVADGLAAASWELGTSYLENGYWFHRAVFAELLERLLPDRLVRTSAPQSTEVTVTHQAPAAGRGARWIVHVVNYSPLRSSPNAIELLEDPIPLRDVRVALAIDAPVGRVYEARTGDELVLERVGGQWTTTVPSAPVTAMVVFEETG
jgi:hypothetical protein